jgi:hypothetical protein
VLRAVTEEYLHRSGLDIKLVHGVDNLAMAMSLVASTRGLALMPAYAKNLLPWSVVSRPLEGEAPTIELAMGYSKSNTSPILKLFPVAARRTGGAGPGAPTCGFGFSRIAPRRPLASREHRQCAQRLPRHSFGGAKRRLIRVCGPKGLSRTGLIRHLPT